VKKVWHVPTETTTYFIYDALGRLAMEDSSLASTSMGTAYPFTDMLGSVRVVTKDDETVSECYDYLPFGRMLYSGKNGRSSCYPSNPDQQITSALPQKFTGKERDAETGLDYLGFRYYSGAQGRWTSPDQPFADQHLEDPQSWNLYGYVRNRPLNMIDTDGRQGALILGQAQQYQYIYGIPPAKETLQDVKIKSIGAGIIIGGTFAPQIAGALLNWFLMHREQATELAEVALSPVPQIVPSFELASAAKTLGFKPFEIAKGVPTVVGQLENGATIAANIARTADQLSISIPMIHGPAGTLSMVENGATNLARAEGLSEVFIRAVNATDQMGRHLRMNGFVREIVNGQATENWTKTIHVSW
jgi:RHS repeat-associated protein